MPPRVNLATHADEEAVRRLLSHTESPFDFGTEIARLHARLWVVREADEEAPAGFLLVWDVADEMHVIDLAVADSHRRRGLARKLLETALEHARSRAVRRVVLEVRHGNSAAIQLYAAHGFERVGERLAYYADGEDAVLMQLSLG